MTPGDGRHINRFLAVAGEIEALIVDGQAAFDCDEVLRERVWHRFNIVGEVVHRFSSEFRAAHPEVPLRELRELRNLVVHDYDEPDYQRDWLAASVTLPRTASVLREIFEDCRRSQQTAG